MPDVELPNPDDIEELKQKTFTKFVALTVAVYAVMLAICSLGGSNVAKEMMQAQLESSNQWAFYQAKAIREHQCRIAYQRLEIDLLERGAAMTPETRQKAQALLESLRAEEQRYDSEQKKIYDDARAEEAKRKDNVKKDPYFDYAEVLLQIAIVLASVAMLSSSRPVFVLSLLLAVVGALMAANAFAGVPVNLPFLGE